MGMYVLSLGGCVLLMCCIMPTLGKIHVMTEELVMHTKLSLYSKAQIISNWTATDMHAMHKDVRRFILRKNRGITDKEVAMMKQIVRRLNNISISNSYNLDYFTSGRKCTSTERHRQATAIKHATIGICVEESAYKIAHMGFPEAKVFIDIGCNKGYTTALIAGLWEGYSSGLSPYLLFQKYEMLNLFQHAPSPAGYCRTGLDRAFPLLCPELPVPGNRHKDGQCDIQHVPQDNSEQGIFIHAIDGSSSAASVLKLALRELSPHNTTRLFNNIHISHLAMSDTEGMVRFAQIVKGEGNAGFEGGRILHRHRHSEDRRSLATTKSDDMRTDMVQMSTLNSYAKRHNITNQIHFIKIDAEGHDLDVIQGSNETFSAVGIILWEQAKATKQLALTLKHLEKWHFDCFIPEISGFFKLTGNCFPQTARIPEGVNVVCASRVIAPGAALAFDLLSYIHE